MKTSTRFLSTLTIAFFSISLLPACSNTENNYQVGTGNQKTKLLAEEETRFLSEAHSAALFNMQLATEARIRSTASESVSFAENVINSSNKTMANLSSIASEYGLVLTSDMTKEQKRKWKELVKQKGWTFDKTFASMMEKNLKNMYNVFSDASRSISNASISKAVSAALTELEEEGKLAIAQQEKIKERIGERDTSKEGDEDVMAVNTSKRSSK